MGLFSRLLGHHGDAQPQPDQAGEHGLAHRQAPAAYDPGLIARLTDDNRELLRTCKAAQAAAADGRFDDIAHLLAHLRHTFHAQAAAEHARLYPYLQQRVARDPEAVALIAGARREMDELGFEVMKVVDAYLAYPPTHLNEAPFRYDLEQAGASLARRVQKVEAQLYSLYHP